MTDQLTIEAFEEDEEVTLPVRWVVCHTCRGKGTSCAYLGAYTADEMEEAGDDFREDYMNGVYDRTCDECNGRTTVQEVDTDALPADLRGRWFDWLHEEAEMRHTEAMERRMGA